MASKITPEQQADLNAHSGQPVPVQGDAGDVVCYMVDVTAFLHMQGLSGEPSAENEQRLKAMIQEGLDSPDIPAEQVYQELRERVKQEKQSLALISKNHAAKQGIPSVAGFEALGDTWPI